MGNYQPYEYKGKAMLIDRYLILDERPYPEEQYDIFSLEPDPEVKKLLSDQINISDYPVFADKARDFFSTFCFRENYDTKRYYLYTQVYSKTKTKIIVNINATKGKLWVNGKCISIHLGDYSSQYYLTLHLNKGVNHFLLEQMRPKDGSRFMIQLRNYNFEMTDDYRALSQVSHAIAYDPLVLIHEPPYIPTNPTFRMMYFTNNTKDYFDEYRIDIHDSCEGFIKTFHAKLNETVCVNLKELRELSDETLRHEWLGCVFKRKNDEDFVSGPCIVVKNFIEKAEEVNNRLEALALEQPKPVYEHVIGRLRKNAGTTDIMTKYNLANQSRDILTWLENNSYPHEFYKKPGVYELAVHSDLDDSFIRIGIRIPKNYNPQKAYPAFIALATGNDGWTGWMIPEDDLTESCLCFDVTGRGFTGGSYVGEASTFEVIRWIKENFKLDEERLYFIGQSNGGYATYALAQNHPAIPAAIFPEIGYPHIDTIKNITNIPTYQMVSPQDHVFAGRENEVSDKLKKYGNYYQYDFKEMIHHHLIHHITHKQVLNSLLQHRRNLYPNTIYFKTYRNRHLESDWIKLHGIEYGRRFAEVKAEIVNPHTIKLRVSGANGVTVTLPPQIDHASFQIVVNNKAFSFQNYDGFQVFLKKEKTWQIYDREEAVDYRKGTGLLDVYLDSLRIILPEAADDFFHNIAAHFAHPYTNGFDPKVYVDYPIYTESTVPNHIFGYNLILLDDNYSNPYAARLKEKLTVRYDEAGYEYQGVRYDGDYVIMQSLPNPYDCRRSVLLVSANSRKLSRRHILLRKVIIPYYTNGLHELWNNEALIFDGKNYSCIYEQNAPIKKI